MKIATLNHGGPDGTLAIVSSDGATKLTAFLIEAVPVMIGGQVLEETHP